MGYVLDLNNNDDLSTVIKKCNTNFQSLARQSDIQNLNEERETDIKIDEAVEIIEQEIDGAVQGLVQDIEHEAGLRNQGDQDLNNRIDTIDAKFDNYLLITDLPVAPVDAAYLTFGTDDPADTYGGTWSLVGSLQAGTDSVNVWRKTAS